MPSHVCQVLLCMLCPAVLCYVVQVLTLAGELLSNAETLLRDGLHTAEIADGYQRAADKVRFIRASAQPRMCVHLCFGAKTAQQGWTGSVGQLLADCTAASVSSKVNP